MTTAITLVMLFPTMIQLQLLVFYYYYFAILS